MFHPTELLENYWRSGYKAHNIPQEDTPEVQKLTVLKFNNYSRLSIDLNIIFADGFAVILSAVALPVFNPKVFHQTE